jgi:hypothetical protein
MSNVSSPQSFASLPLAGLILIGLLLRRART